MSRRLELLTQGSTGRLTALGGTLLRPRSPRYCLHIGAPCVLASPYAQRTQPARGHRVKSFLGDEVRADQLVDLPPGGATFQASHDLTVLDHEERRNLRDVQLAGDRRISVSVDVDDAKALLLGHLHPCDEAFHTPRRSILARSHKEKRRQARGRLRLAKECLLRLHPLGVPAICTLQTTGGFVPRPAFVLRGARAKPGHALTRRAG